MIWNAPTKYVYKTVIASVTFVGLSTIFERDFEKNVTTQVTFTDDDGIAKFKVIEGNEYLIDNVIIEVNEDPENDAVWSSYWAALTFRALNATQ